MCFGVVVGWSPLGARVAACVRLRGRCVETPRAGVWLSVKDPMAEPNRETKKAEALVFRLRTRPLSKPSFVALTGRSVAHTRSSAAASHGAHKVQTGALRGEEAWRKTAARPAFFSFSLGRSGVCFSLPAGPKTGASAADDAHPPEREARCLAGRGGAGIGSAPQPRSRKETPRRRPFVFSISSSTLAPPSIHH